MHHQIRTVIATIRYNTSNVAFSLTAGERTPLGTIVGMAYYSLGITSLVDREQISGYPNNGGQHTFDYRGPFGDAVAMLELIKESLEKRFKPPYGNEEARVLSELSYVSQEILSAKADSKRLSVIPAHRYLKPRTIVIG